MDVFLKGAKRCVRADRFRTEHKTVWEPYRLPSVVPRPGLYGYYALGTTPRPWHHTRTCALGRLRRASSDRTASPMPRRLLRGFRQNSWRGGGNAASSVIQGLLGHL